MSGGRSAVEKLIGPALSTVEKRAKGGYFYHSEIMAQVLSNHAFAGALGLLDDNPGPWEFGEIIRKWLSRRISGVLRTRDPNRIRIWESYHAPGERENRYMRLREMDRDALRAAMREARTQERHFHIKGEGYQFFLDELEELGPTARVNDVYDRALPDILRHRSRGAA